MEKGEYRLPSHEHFEREVYTCLISGQAEGQLFAFKIDHEGWYQEPKIYYYRNFNTKSMKIINGGDIGNNKHAKNINLNAIKDYDADVIFVGGDIAYDNNIPTCYY